MSSLSPLPVRADIPPITPLPSSQSSEILHTLISHYQQERKWIKHAQEFIDASCMQRASHPNATPVPLWKRRKTHREPHLCDHSHAELSQHILVHHAYGLKTLKLYDDLLDARIRSCLRVERLILQSLRHKNWRHISEFSLSQTMYHFVLTV